MCIIDIMQAALAHDLALHLYHARLGGRSGKCPGSASCVSEFGTLAGLQTSKLLLRLQTSRLGRVRYPPLAFWMSETKVHDKQGGAVAIARPAALQRPPKPEKAAPVSQPAASQRPSESKRRQATAQPAAALQTAAIISQAAAAEPSSGTKIISKAASKQDRALQQEDPGAVTAVTCPAGLHAVSSPGIKAAAKLSVAKGQHAVPAKTKWQRCGTCKSCLMPRSKQACLTIKAQKEALWNMPGTAPEVAPVAASVAATVAAAKSTVKATKAAAPSRKRPRPTDDDTSQGTNTGPDSSQVVKAADRGRKAAGRRQASAGHAVMTDSSTEGGPKQGNLRDSSQTAQEQNPADDLRPTSSKAPKGRSKATVAATRKPAGKKEKQQSEGDLQQQAAEALQCLRQSPVRPGLSSPSAECRHAPAEATSAHPAHQPQHTGQAASEAKTSNQVAAAPANGAKLSGQGKPQILEAAGSPEAPASAAVAPSSVLQLLADERQHLAADSAPSSPPSQQPFSGRAAAGAAKTGKQQQHGAARQREGEAEGERGGEAEGERGGEGAAAELAPEDHALRASHADTAQAEPDGEADGEPKRGRSRSRTDTAPSSADSEAEAQPKRGRANQQRSQSALPGIVIGTCTVSGRNAATQLYLMPSQQGQIDLYSRVRFALAVAQPGHQQAIPFSCAPS